MGGDGQLMGMTGKEVTAGREGWMDGGMEGVAVLDRRVGMWREHTADDRMNTRSWQKS